MKYYYSIANFAVGTFTNIFNKFFYTETQTYQQLFGEMLIWSRGNNVSVENLVNSNIIPQQFVDSWGEDLARNITNEFTYHILNLEHSNNWNGDLLHTIPLSLPQVIMDWSTVTTIGAGILDTIGYYTNYSLLSWSSPICLPNIIWQNVLLGGLVGVGVGLGVVGIIGLELVPGGGLVGLGAGAGLVGLGAGAGLVGLGAGAGLVGLGAGAGLVGLGAGAGLVGLGAGGGLVGLRVVGLGYAGEIFLQYVTDTTITSLVEKHGLESIKPLHEAGAKFSNLSSLYIEKLVEKYGIKILHPESIKDEIIADEILIESQKETSLIQKENIYYDTAEEIENTNTTDTYDTLEGN